jgi:hypothetical protein
MVCYVGFLGFLGDCSKDTGFIQPVHDGVRRGCVDGLRLGLHATYRRPSGHGSARAFAPGRHSFASCDSGSGSVLKVEMSTLDTQSKGMVVSLNCCDGQIGTDGHNR